MRVLLVLPVLALLAPAAAHATSVRVATFVEESRGDVYTGDLLRIEAHAGERNRITMRRSVAGHVLVEDPGSIRPLRVGRLCRRLSRSRALCRRTDQLQSAQIELGDRSDRFSAPDPVLPALYVRGRAGDDRISATYASLNANGGPGRDRISGGRQDDTLDGGTGPDVLRGGGGTDYLTGDAGRDHLLGGPGDDTLDGDGSDGPATDRLDGGGGKDTLTYGLRSTSVTVDLARRTGGGSGERDRLRSFERVIGGQARDRLLGDDRSNDLRDFSGIDTVYGRGGDDELEGGVVHGGVGADRVVATDRRSSCGTGKDVVSVNFRTVFVAKDCEAVDLAGIGTKLQVAPWPDTSDQQVLSFRTGCPTGYACDRWALRIREPGATSLRLGAPLTAVTLPRTAGYAAVVARVPRGPLTPGSGRREVTVALEHQFGDGVPSAIAAAYRIDLDP